MAYAQQIKILEQKLEQLSRMPSIKGSTDNALQIQQDLRKLKRLEWEENYERLKLEEER